MVAPGRRLSLSKQCMLLGVSRSSYYYRPKGESCENLALMRRMDELHMDHPFDGSRQMMQLMGMEATYRRPRTSIPNSEHRVPYPLRGLEISRADHVWCADITYVPVSQGFFYLVAVMDWATRHVLSWRLSNTMDATFCTAALDEALRHATPEILNTDPRLPVHECDLRRPSAASVLYGRSRPIPGQHLHRTAVEVPEVRGCVPA